MSGTLTQKRISRFPTSQGSLAKYPTGKDMFGVRITTLRRLVKASQLKVSKTSGKNFYNMHEWLDYLNRWRE